MSQITHLLDLIRRAFHFCRDDYLQQSCRVTNASRYGDECFRREGMLFRQHVKSITYIIELLNFAQDGTRIHGVRGFPERA